MSDVSLTKRATHNYAIAGLVFTGAVVALTTYFGNPTNSLHTSAQAWAFAGFFGIMISRGFDSLLDFLKKS